MEAVAAVGLATNILQIVEVAKDITSIIKDIRKSASGFARETTQFQQSAKLIREGIDTLTNTTSAQHSPNDSLRQQVLTLRGQLDDFEARLISLHSKNTKSFYQACRTAIRIWCQRDRLLDCGKTIHEKSNAISVHLVTIYLPSMDVKLAELLEQDEKLGTQLSDSMTHLMQLLRTSRDMNQENGNMLESLKQWLATQDERAVELGCLQALTFPDIDSRADAIKTAHEETFRWVLNEAADSTSATESESAGVDASRSHKHRFFLNWLRSNNHQENVFCVFGKPGAGKSTLMKYIARQDALKKELQGWAGDRELIIAQHFFWIHGSVTQRSLTGLLQSLLLQILREDRKFIPIAFPNQDWLVGGTTFKFSKELLGQALSRVLQASSNRGVCLFFLVDGLDEFNDREDSGNPTLEEELKLVKFLRLFRSQKAVKLCVASRPYPTFITEFDNAEERSIAIHDLTRNDISKYAHRTLNENSDFHNLATNDTAYYQLIDELIASAEGVWLWVHLACHSLLEGILNQDRIPDLYERLRQLPQGLSELYKHILSRIPQVYQKSAATSLIMASLLSSYGGTWLLAHTYLDDSERHMLDTLSQLDLDHMRKEGRRTQKRVVAQCRGFLEVVPTNPNPMHSAMQQVDFARLHVRFAHRSMADFVQVELESTLLPWAGLPPTAYGGIFQACISTVKALTLLSNSLPFPLLKEHGHNVLCGVLVSSLNHCASLILSLDPMKRGDQIRIPVDGDHDGLCVSRWGAFRDVACQPLRHHSTKETIHAVRRNSMIIEHSIWDFLHQNVYTGLALAICLGWDKYCRYELRTMRAAIDTMHDYPFLDFAVRTHDCAVVQTFVELDFNLERVYKPIGQSLWHAMLQRTYTEPCQFRGPTPQIREELRNLFTYMLPRIGKLDTTLSFGFVIAHHAHQREISLRAYVMPVRKAREVEKNSVCKPTIKFPSADSIRASITQSKFNHLEKAQYEVDWSKSFFSERTFKCKLEIGVVVHFTAMELARNVYTVGFLCGALDQADAENLIPLPPDIASRLENITRDGEETPGQAMITLHCDNCAICKRRFGYLAGPRLPT